MSIYIRLESKFKCEYFTQTINLYFQCTGEAMYVDDLPEYPDQLYGAFVKSTVANATVQTIDTTEAMVGMMLMMLLVVLIMLMTTMTTTIISKLSIPKYVHIQHHCVFLYEYALRVPVSSR